MIEKTFASGNYNAWETFIKETLPLKNSVFREKVIPRIDQTLESMLGVYASIKKTSIDITPTFDEYLTIRANIVYSVEDFNAPDVPTAAVEKDVTAITNTLKEQIDEEFATIEEVDIDINTGELKVIAAVAVKF